MSASPVLFAVPALMIIGGWWRGTHPEERRMTLGVAAITGLGTVAALLWVDATQAELAKGCAYSLVVICTASLAMLIRRRGGDDGLGDGEPLNDPPPVDGDHDPPPFDWDEFERGFRDEVERRERERIPA